MASLRCVPRVRVSSGTPAYSSSFSLVESCTAIINRKGLL